ncbi:MAG: hypothetical protein RLZZ117_2428, partial [Cyanobacteriota bacterium]
MEPRHGLVGESSLQGRETSSHAIHRSRHLMDSCAWSKFGGPVMASDGWS